MKAISQSTPFLTEEDIEFLDSYKAWLKESLAFSFGRKAPSQNDLVVTKVGCEFVTIGELMSWCEKSATNKMIYEAWLDDVLNNIYSTANTLHGTDGERLLAYFKSHYSVDDPDALSSEASAAITEASLEFC